ncbi:hypothetical protein ZWY2020_034048 [Hordeum vulgare]|nr:hypothetical protein ZWY2020_034048 [Hordeum vulgare]
MGISSKWIKSLVAIKKHGKDQTGESSREVLANYPEGTTALRELIQNTDDTGASRVLLCLDRRAHGSYSLLGPALAQWQGPALLAHNDAAFTDNDFASISRIGGSKKAS